MKHYNTNDRYTDKKHPKGKYKGDEKKIHNSLSQPDKPLKEWWIIQEYVKSGGKLEDVIDEKQNKLTIIGALLCISACIKFTNKFFEQLGELKKQHYDHKN